MATAYLTENLRITDLAKQLMEATGTSPETIAAQSPQVAEELAVMNGYDSTKTNRRIDAGTIITIPDQYAAAVGSGTFEQVTPSQMVSLKPEAFAPNVTLANLRDIADAPGLVSNDYNFNRAFARANGLSSAEMKAIENRPLSILDRNVNLPLTMPEGGITYDGLESNLISGKYDLATLSPEMVVPVTVQIAHADGTSMPPMSPEEARDMIAKRGYIPVMNRENLEKLYAGVPAEDIPTQYAEALNYTRTRAETQVAQRSSGGVIAAAAAAESSALQTTAPARDAAHERREDHYAELETRREEAAVQTAAAEPEKINLTTFALSVNEVMKNEDLTPIQRKGELIGLVNQLDESVKPEDAHTVLQTAAKDAYPENVTLLSDTVMKQSQRFADWTPPAPTATASVEALESPEPEATQIEVAGPAAAPAADTPARTALRRGDRGDDVKALQEKLQKLGFDVGEADGIFGGKTDKAVRQMQTALGFSGNDVDGVAGPKTFGAMETALAQNPVPDLEAKYKEMAASAAKPPVTRPDRPVEADAPASVEPKVDTATLAKTGANIVLGAKTMTRDTFLREQAALDEAAEWWNNKDFLSYHNNGEKAEAHREAGMPEIPADVKRALESGISVSFTDAKGEPHTIDTSVASEQDRKAEMKELAAAIQAGPLEDVKAASAPDAKGQKLASNGPDMNGIY